MAVFLGGSVPRGGFARVYPFLGARVRLPEHYISRVGLCSAFGGLWFSLAPPEIRRMDRGPTVRQWVDKLSRDQAVMAAIHLQRDVGLMQTNVDVLDQYALSLQKAASRMIDNCLVPCMYPGRGGCGGCPWTLGPPRRGTNGRNGAVASVHGSATAPLEGQWLQ